MERLLAPPIAGISECTLLAAYVTYEQCIDRKKIYPRELECTCVLFLELRKKHLRGLPLTIKYF